jgi:DNA-binding transcriptional regulator YdaS (Cro superfamily)
MDELRKWRQKLPEYQRTLVAAGRLLGVSEVQMHRYETGQRKIPATRVIQWETITGIPRHKLRPDVFPAERRTKTAIASLA